MAITQSINSKGNVKKFTNNDIPFSPSQPVIASYYAISGASQTIINLPFSTQTTGASANTDSTWIFVDGKKLDLGSSNDYLFTTVGADGSSSQVTLNQTLISGLNIQAFKLGLKKESEFGIDNRLVSLYANMNSGFQGFVDQSVLMTPVLTSGSPAAGTFWSSIPNRASMIDLSQDLKPRIGIERTMFLGCQQILNELGASGEQIFGAVNDTFNQVRFVGSWQNLDDTNGVRPQSGANSNDYMEVTFYGTGLNLLAFVASTAYNAVAAVDGGAEGSNIFSGSASSILSGRSYNMNQVTPVVSGLSLGIHTVKIRNNGGASAALVVYGYEVVNVNATSTNISVNPGIGYIQGQKLALSAQNLFSYSAPVTGSRGGRVLVYQASDGSVGKSFQAVNASQANLSSADHTNEEIVRVYHWREFASGRSDDFTGVDANTSYTRTFTIEDGTTTLIGSTVYANSTGTAIGGLVTQTGGFWTLTFVGTGLDISGGNRAQTGTITFTVDGTSIGSYTSTNGDPLKVYKIVSGLPYGVHTVKLSASGSDSFALHQFKVYQPKKPSLPSGAIELADYNVMANFVFATSGSDATNRSTGVLSKYSGREFTFVGTGWTYGPGATSDAFGLNLSTNVIGDYLEYNFFGTGISILLRADGIAGSATVQIDGAAYTGAASVLGSGNTWTPGTSTYAMSATADSNSQLQISGLTLGLHKVRFTKSAGASFMRLNGAEIQTPIHSYKSNSNADFQNTLPLGSCAISDNRKITPVKDALPAIKSVVQAVGVTNSPSTTSTAFTPIPDMSATISIKSTTMVQISFNSVLIGLGGATVMEAYITLDGVAIQSTPAFNIDLSSSFPAQLACYNIIAPVGPGVHKVDVFWRSNSGASLRSSNDRRVLIVKEL